MTMEIKLITQFVQVAWQRDLFIGFAMTIAVMQMTLILPFFLTAFFSDIKAKNGRIAQLIGGYFYLMVC